MKQRVFSLPLSFLPVTECGGRRGNAMRGFGGGVKGGRRRRSVEVNPMRIPGETSRQRKPRQKREGDEGKQK